MTIWIQPGVNDCETVDISIKALTAEALGVHDGTDPIDLSSAAGASAALTTLDTAIQTVATERANLGAQRSEEHTSELQSLMRISYAVFCLKKKKNTKRTTTATK